ncbi:putative zinc finger protein [Orchesella cincta]|uniref:Putative zinc finger protein n=1 Tax=Orchesella cincta TaxID=48709 RepID=A0A1D2MS80_ORCCI|nr:putative zinc finger protein [Orchesella cincta]
MEYMLESHMRMHARREKSFPCKECGKVFPRADTLRRHVQSKHEPEETMPYCCDHCGKMFGRKDRLVQHARTHFTQSESFDCHLCGATFR